VQCTDGRGIDGREYVRGGKRLEGICPGVKNDGREYVREGICLSLLDLAIGGWNNIFNKNI